ncbi:Xaa-Pro aminopeptidase [Flavobacteriaceae bacterium MAR_2010_188]|nr:Xaa-Pro aminopeptidase [Flavobacteriaceae bacterium MAR_2010_188]
MKQLVLILALTFSVYITAQEDTPSDYLSSNFHKERREMLRKKMPANSVAVFFANAERNRANDVDYVYHQDPDFYYLTGYKEPNSVLLIFSENQNDESGGDYNEILYVQEKNENAEMWTGKRLGTEGAKSRLGFNTVFNGKEFLNNKIDFSNFDVVMHPYMYDDYRNGRDIADLANLVEHFKSQIEVSAPPISQTTTNVELNQTIEKAAKIKVDTRSLRKYMGELREVKSEEELQLLKKAIRISAMGQIEVMKAMHTGMSEAEIQGIHEYVYKKYGSEYEGYPSIVGAGNNGCVLHYIENSKTKVNNDLVLMDLGAEYHGYTADVTRTIPANGKFTTEQKAIYDLVYKAQEAGIKAAIVGNNMSSTHQEAKKSINQGLKDLGIIATIDEAHNYFPHGTSHHIGLDVHDLNSNAAFSPNMVITVEPGIYIPDGSACDKKWWGIAVRIEDDILITEDTPIILSAEAPRKSDEIEKLMKQESIFDKISLPNLDEN